MNKNVSLWPLKKPIFLKKFCLCTFVNYFNVFILFSDSRTFVISSQVNWGKCGKYFSADVLIITSPQVFLFEIQQLMT